MLHTLQSRILVVVGILVFLTAGIISLLAQHSLEEAVFKAKEEHARDLMHAVFLSVENEYQSLVFHKQATLERRQSELKNIVTLGVAHLSESYADFQKGLMPEKQAKSKAIEHLRTLRYDDGVGYLWVNDIERPIPRMIMHPTLPQLDGKILDDPIFNTAQGTGRNLFVAMVDACLDKGEGYVDYLWPKPTHSGLTDQQPKTSYVKLFKPWGWVVGTGVYIDDIEEEEHKRLDAVIAELGQTFSQVRVAETGYMFIFNGHKEMLIHPNIMGPEFKQLLNPTTGHPIVDDFIKASHTPDKSFDYIWDKPDDKGHFAYWKRAYVSYFKPLDWYIASSMYLDEIAEPGKKLRDRIVSLSALSLAIALLFSVFLSRNLAKPLGQLTEAALGIEKQGIRGNSIPISGTAETKQLGAVLNRMLGSIRQAIKEKESALDALAASNADLAMSNSHLEKEIAERKQAEAKLLESNRELDTFVYTVSHDLRSPLTPILGYAEMLKEMYRDKMDDQALDFLSEIEKHGNKMLAQMEDLLALARVGRLERPTRPVETTRVVDEVITELTEQFANARSLIRCGPLPELVLPETLISQLFTNLIGNALRYGNASGHGIEVGGERRGSLVRFYVRDHGSGIPEEERQRIFDPFYRGTTGQNTRGTGIGLAIVQKISRLYGGHCWVEDTPGGGSTFRIELTENFVKPPAENPST